MPFVKLASTQPQALGKNALLQKQYDVERLHIEQDHRLNKRAITKIAEQCVSTAYGLLLEAEDHEKERHNYHKQYRTESVQSTKRNRENRTTSRTTFKIRPLTAEPPCSSTPRVSHSDIRPASAHPNLGKQLSIIEPTPEEEDDDVFSQKDAQETNENTHIIKPLAIMPKLAFTEHRNSFLKVNTNRSHSEKSNNSTRRPSEPPSYMLSPKGNNAAETESIREVRNIQNETQSRRRPRTAVDFRRKLPDDERSEYWNKRVEHLIRKWDLNEFPNKFQSETLNSGPDVLVLQPSKPPTTHLPKHLQKPTTNAEHKTKIFLQTYGNQHRSMLRPHSASTTELGSKRYRRPVKVTVQELTSIKADFSRRRKNTVAILRKSKRILNHIQGLAQWKSET